MQHPVVVYADFESINLPIGDDDDETDQHRSGTILRSKHVCSGYSYTVVSPHCANRVRTYRGEDAGKHFLESIMEEEIKISKWLEENEKKKHNLSPEEKKQWKEEKTCHICKEKFLKDSTNPMISIELKQLLEANKMDCTKIPSLKLVNRQKRIISRQLHPDKLGDVSNEEKFAKEEELKKFNVENENLQKYLIQHELLVDEEQDEEFEPEDELTEEEIERIKKKGSKVIDHDHWTGKYRGAAHSGCNIALRKTRKIPVIFRNLTGKFYFLIYSIFS